MIIDVNTYIGHWPFRQLRHNSADDLLRLMDDNDIDKAMVSSINAIFYKNSHVGNEELFAETKNYRDRLIPFATLNPQYPGWEDDLRQCHEDFGMIGLRLFPHYHNYKFTDDSKLDMIQHASEQNIVISVPIRLEDRRQRHWLDCVDDLPLSEIESAMRQCPKAKFIILNGIGFENSGLAKDETLKSRDFLIEFSRLSSVLRGDIPKLIEIFGESKLAYGTGVPFNYPAPALLKIQVLDVSEQTKIKIRWENAVRLLG